MFFLHIYRPVKIAYSLNRNEYFYAQTHSKTRTRFLEEKALKRAFLLTLHIWFMRHKTNQTNEEQTATDIA